ncbi:MAG: hypothetical protein ACRESV_07895, partial [Nevskiales bacterium]
MEDSQQAACGGWNNMGEQKVMDLELAKKALETGIKFVANSGLRVVELRRGYVKCQMPIAGNGNHLGTMYA